MGTPPWLGWFSVSLNIGLPSSLLHVMVGRGSYKTNVAMWTFMLDFIYKFYDIEQLLFDLKLINSKMRSTFLLSTDENPLEISLQTIKSLKEGRKLLF